MRKIVALIFVIVALVWVGNAFAVPLGQEYELISPNPLVGTPIYTPGTDLGYFIWTDDLERYNWHIRWSGAGPNADFSGTIALSGSVFDTIATFSFDASDYASIHNDYVNYIAIANIGEDGFDFSLTQTSALSFVGFDLFINGSQQIGDNIFFGQNNISAASLGTDGDFKIAAPVPEPRTLLLLGFGLLGLLFMKRRKT